MSKKQACLKRWLSVLTFLIIAITCSSQDNSVKRKEERWKEVSYGSFGSNKMDIYLPANRNLKTPFVILIHGGAWVGGDKVYEAAMQDSLLAHGIASVNINYRLADSAHIHYAEILADIDSAVNYCIAHADVWHTRKQNFITSGTSAGGHLSLLYGYTTDKKISAIIARCPPTDLTDTALLNYELRIGILPAIQQLTGAAYVPGSPLPVQFSAASPVYHVKNIPTFIIHGTADKTVPYSQALLLTKKLTAKKITHKLISLEGADHDLNPKPPITLAGLCKDMINWVWKYGN